MDVFLNDPANAVSTSPSVFTAGAGTKSALQHSETTEPVELGKVTNQYVPALTQLCQAKCVTPVFDIQGKADKPAFGGRLTLGDTVITLSEEYRSKKEAKERLAEQGLDIVKAMEVSKRENAAPHGENRVNWVGQLQRESPLCWNWGSSSLPVILVAASISLAG